MADNGKERRMDELLDSLLSTYSAVEPRPGIEMRIRARLKAYNDRRRNGMLVFAFSAAMVIVALVIRTRTESPGPIAPGTTPYRAVTVNAGRTPGIRHARSVPSEAARVKPAMQDKTTALIQLANTIQTENEHSSEEAGSDAIAAQENQAPEQKDAEKAGIQNLDVQSLEIKELAPPRSDEKGNL